MLKNISLFFILGASGCSSGFITSKHPDQSRNIKDAPSFHDQCASGEYGEWSKGFICSKLTEIVTR